MTDILSQDEIDALLSAISDGDASQHDSYSRRDERRVKIYDFKRPIFLSKHNLIAIETIAKEYAKDLGVYLTENFGINISVDHSYTTQITFEEFQRSIPKKTYLTVLGMMPLKGYAVTNIEPIGYKKILYILGKTEPDYSKEELSQVESSLVVIHTGLLRSAFSKILDLRPIIQSTVSDPFHLNYIDRNIMCLELTFDICFNISDNSYIESQMQLCIPRDTLEPIKPALNLEYLSKTKKLDLALDNIPIPVQIRYKDKLNVYLSDLEKLQPGIILKLKNKDLEICY